jgi:hypothetical protein
VITLWVEGVMQDVERSRSYWPAAAGSAAIALELAAALGFWQIVELGDHVESP